MIFAGMGRRRCSRGGVVTQIQGGGGGGEMKVRRGQEMRVHREYQCARYIRLRITIYKSIGEALNLHTHTIIEKGR